MIDVELAHLHVINFVTEFTQCLTNGDFFFWLPKSKNDRSISNCAYINNDRGLSSYQQRVRVVLSLGFTDQLSEKGFQHCLFDSNVNTFKLKQKVGT